MKKSIYMLYSVMLLFLIVKCASTPPMLKIEDKKIAVPAQKYSKEGIQLEVLELENQNDEIISDSTVLVWQGDLPGMASKHPAKAKAKFNKKTAILDLEVLIPEDTVSVKDTNTYIKPPEETKSEFKFWGYWLLGFLILLAIVLFIWKAK